MQHIIKEWEQLAIKLNPQVMAFLSDSWNKRVVGKLAYDGSWLLGVWEQYAIMKIIPWNPPLNTHTAVYASSTWDFSTLDIPETTIWPFDLYVKMNQPKEEYIWIVQVQEELTLKPALRLWFTHNRKRHTLLIGMDSDKHDTINLIYCENYVDFLKAKKDFANNAYTFPAEPEYEMTIPLYQLDNMSATDILKIQNRIKKDLKDFEANREQAEKDAKDPKKQIGVDGIYSVDWIWVKVENINELDNYVNTKNVNLKAIISAFITNKPCLLVWPSWVGKTSAIDHIAKLTGNSVVRIPVHGTTSVDDIIGTTLLDWEWTWFSDGLLTHAVKTGKICIIDEINAMSPEVAFSIHSLLDDSRKLIITKQGVGWDSEQIEITPHPNFRLFATMNKGDEYVGTKELNPSFSDRFPIEVHIWYPDIEDELQIIQRHVPIKEKYARDFINIANWLRAQYEKWEYDASVSVRSLINCIQLIPTMWFKEAVLSVIANKITSDKKKIESVMEMFRLRVWEKSNDELFDEKYLKTIPNVYFNLLIHHENIWKNQTETDSPENTNNIWERNDWNGTVSRGVDSKTWDAWNTWEWESVVIWWGWDIQPTTVGVWQIPSTDTTQLKEEEIEVIWGDVWETSVIETEPVPELIPEAEELPDLSSEFDKI